MKPLADITPKDFRKIERRLIATITPAWCEQARAVHEARQAPPPKPKKPHPTWQKRPNGKTGKRREQVKAAADALVAAGEPITARRIAEVADIPRPTVYWQLLELRKEREREGVNV